MKSKGIVIILNELWIKYYYVSGFYEKDNYLYYIMILKNIIFLVNLITLTQVNAQEYQPFPSENARWVYYHSMEGLNYWTLYYLNGDTTVNQRTYQVLNRKKWYKPNSNPNILEDIYFREENKRIYFTNILNNEEDILTYDFNLTVGDTFYLKSFDTLVVKQDYFENGDRKLFLECFNNEYLGVKITDTWIEGIGSDNNLLIPDLFSSLMCFEGDYEQSETCDYIIDQILAVAELNNVQLKKIIYPNPTCDKLYFQIDDQKYNKYKIFDLNGKLTKFEIIENNYIDVSSLPEGTYLLQLIGNGFRSNNKFEKTNNR